MMMATFNYEGAALGYAIWNLYGFLGAFLINSFVEWGAHRFFLHSPKIVRFAYDLHDRTHHVLFGADETYHAQNPEMESHITFVFRDYILFLLVTTPLWIGAELLINRPVLIGGVLATLTGLQLFNSLHLRYHLPSDTWFQRTWFFKFLKEHHRLHHGDTATNFNVAFIPIADFCLGTLAKREKTVRARSRE
jgi:hypothetical protein